jgi:hypothetical protein
MNVTYYLVVPSDRYDEGTLSAGQAQEASNAFAAERRARAIAHQHAGVVVAHSQSWDRGVSGRRHFGAVRQRGLNDRRQ